MKMKNTIHGDKINELLGDCTSIERVQAAIDYLKALGPRDAIRGSHYGWIYAPEYLEYAKRFMTRHIALGAIK